ncbi:MAG: hypothetical protein PHV23_00550 [Candidatus Gracilibacteria bacterium]|nr:hypothetical protein [Candidatus Gracilibacteria bacterium]
MKKVYINLAIRNVVDTDSFFNKLGFNKNEQYSSIDTTNFQINENTYVMLLEDEKFQTFTGEFPNPICNNKIISLQFDNIEEVDVLFNKAINAGATDITKTNDETDKFMHLKSFRDLNGHIWELFFFKI